MTNKSPRLTESIIRTRCSEASFKRGQNYYTGGAIKRRLRHSHTNLEAQVVGSQTYTVTVWLDNDDRLKANCNCPYDYGGDCKHIVAVLLAWINEPESFHPPVDLKAILKKRSKAELIDLLLDIFTIYPSLPDELDVIDGPDDQDLESKVTALFSNMHPWGTLTEDQVEAHLKLIARRADRLARHGQANLACRIYYALINGCVSLCRDYGSYDFFSPDIPYDFAVAYNELAIEQIAENRSIIERELEEIYRDLHNPEALGLDDALAGISYELIEQDSSKA
jgi:hypothetical protein